LALQHEQKLLSKRTDEQSGQHVPKSDYIRVSKFVDPVRLLTYNM